MQDAKRPVKDTRDFLSLLQIKNDRNDGREGLNVDDWRRNEVTKLHTTSCSFVPVFLSQGDGAVLCNFKIRQVIL